MKETEIRVLQPGDESKLETFLLPRIESSMFLISNMRLVGLADHGAPYEGTYAAVFKQGEIVAVVAHYWNQNLIIQAPIYVSELLKSVVRASDRRVKGVIGPGDQISRAKEALGIDDTRIQMDETEKLYKLKLAELVIPANLKSGQVEGRRIRVEDVELSTKWRVEFSVEALGAEDTPNFREECRASVQRSVEEKRGWILEKDGEPVACSLFNTAIDEAVQVGGVWTPPEFRRQGYGRAVVAASLLDARAEGVETAILFTGKGNSAAQKAYEALGFEHIDSYRLLLLKESFEPHFEL